MKKLLLVALLLLAGCDGEYTEYAYGPVQTEPVTVEETTYIPSTTHSGGGMGIDTNGDVSFSTTTLRSPEDWVVVFRCQHGKFIVHDQAAWKLAVKDSTYTCRYRVKYKVGVRVLDGKRTETGRTPVDMDFLEIVR